MSAGSLPPDSINAQIWRVLALLQALPSSPPAEYRRDDLSAKFEILAGSDPQERATAEQEIWSAWCEHSEVAAKSAMAAGIRLLSAGEFAQAETIFDRLVEDYPDWAEAWNKRATVLFLLNRDAASVMDIYRALELEPRHFGALGGFAQICLRNGAAEGARESLLQLLKLNPHADGVAATAATLAGDGPKVLH